MEALENERNMPLELNQNEEGSPFNVTNTKERIEKRREIKNY